MNMDWEGTLQTIFDVEPQGLSEGTLKLCVEYKFNASFMAGNYSGRYEDAREDEYENDFEVVGAQLFVLVSDKGDPVTIELDPNLVDITDDMRKEIDSQIFESRFDFCKEECFHEYEDD